MIKKLSIFLLAIAAFAGFASAQAPVGSWTVYSAFEGADEIVETPGRVYITSSGSLFYFDKDTQEAGAMNSNNFLHDSEITRVRYNPYGQYLMVVYATGNIDKVFDDGRVINISDIRDAVNSYSHTINDVAFASDGKFYVSTSYGVVTFNDQRNEVISTAYTHGKVSYLGVIGSHLLAVQNDTVYVADASQKLLRDDQFLSTKIVSKNGARQGFVDIGRGMGLYHNPNGQLVHVRFNFDDITKLFRQIYVKDPTNNSSNIGFSGISFLPDSTVVAAGTNCLYTFTPTTPTGSPVISKLPESLRGAMVSARDGLAQLWHMGPDGLAQYDASSDTPTQLRAPFKPSPLTTKYCHHITSTPSGKFLVWNRRENDALGYKLASTHPFLNVTSIDGDSFADISPTDVTFTHTSNEARSKKSTRLASPLWVEGDPADPDAYYVASWWEGIYRVKNGKQTHLYNNTNSNLYDYSVGTNPYCFMVATLAFDNFGNLWALQEYNPSYPDPNAIGTFGILAACPAAALQKENTDRSDWVKFPVASYVGRRNSVMTFGKISNCLMFGNGFNLREIGILNTKGTATFADDSYVIFDRYLDQDGKYFALNQFYCFTEDKKGRFWIGTSDGIIEITDPRQATADVVRINHLKVPRNDGTNLADYLLAGQTVTAIAVDASNRKWVATKESGVYLISENGDKILEHFTSDNSPLPSNYVHSVACAPASNAVYFGLEGFLVEYRATSSPAAPDYSNVYAFPNPVRPDYSGWITVTGLMDDSLVKIADSAGNVFAQGRSEGGMFIWDGCNASGQRVKTGVYFVFASQGSDNTGSPSGCVTKILVVN